MYSFHGRNVFTHFCLTKKDPTAEDPFFDVPIMKLRCPYSVYLSRSEVNTFFQ